VFDDKGYKLWVTVYMMTNLGLALYVYISRKVVHMPRTAFTYKS